MDRGLNAARPPFYPPDRGSARLFHWAAWQHWQLQRVPVGRTIRATGRILATHSHPIDLTDTTPLVGMLDNIRAAGKATTHDEPSSPLPPTTPRLAGRISVFCGVRTSTERNCPSRDPCGAQHPTKWRHPTARRSITDPRPIRSWSPVTNVGTRLRCADVAPRHRHLTNRAVAPICSGTGPG